MGGVAIGGRRTGKEANLISRTLFVSRDLNHLRTFLLEGLRVAQEKLRPLAERWRAGEFANHDDFSNAADEPLSVQQITLRAVYHELASLIEHELQQAAPSASPTPAHDMLYRDVVAAVEQHHGISISYLPGFASVERVRAAENAFKHRRGLKSHRKPLDDPKRIPDYYDPDFEAARDAIAEVETFLTALWRSVERASRRVS